jgi:hypothetical protein
LLLLWLLLYNPASLQDHLTSRDSRLTLLWGLLLSTFTGPIITFSIEIR